MALTIDITEGCGASNEVCILLSKKSKVILHFAIHFAVKALQPAVQYSCFIFKSGHDVCIGKAYKDRQACYSSVTVRIPT